MTRGLGILTAIMIGLGAWSAPAHAWPVLYLHADDIHSSSCDQIAPCGSSSTPQAAVVPSPRAQLDPENAIFVLEETSAPFLGAASGDSARVVIAIDAAGYEDLFTIHFPLGSARLSLAATDMTALAALASQDRDALQIWISPSDHSNRPLAMRRLSEIEQVLLQNDVPESAIHLDDGGLDAILNRPLRVANDLES